MFGYVKKIALGVFHFIADIFLIVFWHFSEFHQNTSGKLVEIQFKSYVIDRCQIGVNANRLNVMFWKFSRFVVISWCCMF